MGAAGRRREGTKAADDGRSATDPEASRENGSEGTHGHEAGTITERLAMWWGVSVTY